MLKSCPSCSYIGNDGEHICPFCKADLAVGKPKRSFLKAIWPLAIVLIAGALASCSVDSSGPGTSGASFGALPTSDMSDYFYRKAAGWNYIYSNVENIYNTDGSVAQTLTGSQDTVRSMGFDGLCPDGDSLFRYEISYRVLTSYAGRPYLNVPYLASTKNDHTHGAFVDGGTYPPGTVWMQKRPRPVSTDTILAGMIGRVRTVVDDFSNTGTYTFQKDTIWTTIHLDTVFVWEYLPFTTTMVKSRCLFLRDFKNNDSWGYDIINAPNYGTFMVVDDKNTSITTGVGTFYNAAKFKVKTNEIEDKDFNREFKWYAAFTGPVYQYDWWYVTTDGDHFIKQDFTRSLISLTHN